MTSQQKIEIAIRAGMLAHTVLEFSEDADPFVWRIMLIKLNEQQKEFRAAIEKVCGER